MILIVECRGENGVLSFAVAPVGLSGLDTLGPRGLSLPSMCHREPSVHFLVHCHRKDHTGYLPDRLAPFSQGPASGLRRQKGPVSDLNGSLTGLCMCRVAQVGKLRGHGGIAHHSDVRL